MGEKQGNPSDWSDKTLRAYKTAALLMLVLIMAAGGLHYYITNKQKMLATVTSAAQQQMALVQNIMSLMQQSQAEPEDEGTRDSLKKAASTALDNHLALQPWFESAMRRGTPEDQAALKALANMRGFIEKAMGYVAYAASYRGEDAANFATEAYSIGQKLPEQWGAAVVHFMDAGEKDIDILIYVSLPLYALMLCMLGYEAYGTVFPAMAYITRLREHLDHMAATDMLTGLYTRAMLFKIGGMLISGAQRHKRGLAVLAIDIDNIKKINETYGRTAGDAAIKTVSAALKQALRTSDVIGRVGGEEFGVFLPSTDEYRGGLAAEKLRVAIENAPFDIKDAVILLRVSIGVVELQEHHKTSEDALRAAEAALGRAKEGGGNRVVAWSSLYASAPAAAAPAKAESVK